MFGNKIIKWIKENLVTSGKLFIEARSIYDELYGQGEKVGEDEFKTDHYRHFLRQENLEQELEGLGFNII